MAETKARGKVRMEGKDYIMQNGEMCIRDRVGSGDEVLGAVALLKPDVVLLDVQMPGALLTDGIEAAAAIRDAGALRCV